MEQLTDEWFAARCGRVTASRVSDVVAKTKTSYSAGRATYMGQLIAERLTGQPMQSYSSAAMQWGTETEPKARMAYEFYSGHEVEQAGFLIHPRIAMSGASPDGLVGESGLVEIKCPNTATHIETLLSGKIPKKYETQMLWQMACIDRDFCDFVSYDPRMPEHLAIFVKRLNRDEERISELEKEVEKFLTELDGKLQALEQLSEAA